MVRGTTGGQSARPTSWLSREVTCVLTGRTLDLLRLLVLHQRGAVSKADVERLLKTESGWLKVTDAGYEVMVDG